MIILAATLAVCSCTGSREPLQLKVATYNLRMDTPQDSANAWTYRADAVKALVAYHDFDLFGTQEGFVHQLRDICTLPGYAYTGAGRDDGKDAGEHSAIFYKTDRFAIVDAGNFWLRETPDTPGLGWDATCCNRICSWAKFRELKTGSEFFFFNVHFDHQGVVARQESGKLMIAKIREIANGAPAIATGDFNSTPDTEQIQALSAFMNDARSVTRQAPYGPTGTFNRRFANPIGRQPIDYIFVSNDFTVDKYAVLTDYREFPYFPSDHQPVVADITLGQ
jgi:endonuclease/exonuclease/phosphatase family metal-dependent hydrolase